MWPAATRMLLGTDPLNRWEGLADRRAKQECQEHDAEESIHAREHTGFAERCATWNSLLHHLVVDVPDLLSAAFDSEPSSQRAAEIGQIGGVRLEIRWPSTT